MNRENLSAYERAVEDESNDPRCVPVRLAQPAPEGPAIPYPDYPASDQQTWALLYERQRALLPDARPMSSWMGLASMGFPDDRIPALSDASRVLERTTGWDRGARAGSLARGGVLHVPSAARVSFDRLHPPAARDGLHASAGSLPRCVRAHADDHQPALRRVLSTSGRGGAAGAWEDRRRVERFYWFTVEFGLIRTADGLRIYGNGILSSHAEVEHSLSERVAKIGFDADFVAEAGIRPEPHATAPVRDRLVRSARLRSSRSGRGGTVSQEPFDPGANQSSEVCLPPEAKTSTSGATRAGELRGCGTRRADL